MAWKGRKGWGPYKPSKKPYFLLAIDPGLRHPGFAVVHVFPNARKAVLTLTASLNNEKIEYPEALKRIYDFMSKLIETYKPREIVSERMFSVRNLETQQLFRTVGCMELCAWQNRKKINVLPPKTVKKIITNDGSATKETVRKIIQSKYPGKKFAVHDESDAVAVALSWLITHKYIDPYYEPEEPIKKPKTKKK